MFEFLRVALCMLGLGRMEIEIFSERLNGRTLIIYLLWLVCYVLSSCEDFQSAFLSRNQMRKRDKWEKEIMRMKRERKWERGRGRRRGGDKEEMGETETKRKRERGRGNE